MNLQSLRRLFGNIDYYLLIATILLCAIGIAAIYSSGVDAEGRLVSNEYVKQLVWFVIGFFLLAGAALFDFSRFKDTSWIFFAIAIALLVLTRVAGRVVNGARAWIGIGGFGIQPAEFAKIATVLMLGRYLDSAEYDSSFKKLVMTGLILSLPLMLILIQPDFGSALVFFPAALIMLTLADVDFRYILFGVISILGIFLFFSLPLYAANHYSQDTILNVIIAKTDILVLIFVIILFIAVIAGVGWLKFKKRYYYWLSYAFAILAFSIAGAFAAH
jgi:rod shape determining protein RodA